jgi:hypothetical protein
MNTDFFEKQLTSLIVKQSFADGFVFPDYEGLNVKNILPQIGAIFGKGSLMCSTSKSECLDQVEDVKKVILFIFDGLGYNRLIHHINNHNGTFAEFAEKGGLKPITTVFPSTTSSALTSIFTGLSPAQHQIIGYHMFSKKYGLIYNTLDMKPIYGYSGRVELEKEYAHESKPLLPILEQNGIKTCVITKGAIIGSGLSQVTHKGIEPIPYLSASDMWTHASRALKQSNPNLCVVYYSGVDTLAHRYGGYSEETTLELSSIEHGFDYFINSLPEETKKETMLVMLADHGIAENRQSFYLQDSPELNQHLQLPPVGDGRATYLFCKPDKREQFQSTFEKSLKDFKLFSSDLLIQKGTFGTSLNNEKLKEKLGDFSVLSISDRLLDYPFFDEDREHPQKGAHGGMSAEEMIVPLLSIKLSDL